MSQKDHLRLTKSSLPIDRSELSIPAYPPRLTRLRLKRSDTVPPASHSIVPFPQNFFGLLSRSYDSLRQNSKFPHLHRRFRMQHNPSQSQLPLRVYTRQSRSNEPTGLKPVQNSPDPEQNLLRHLPRYLNDSL